MGRQPEPGRPDVAWGVSGCRRDELVTGAVPQAQTGYSTGLPTGFRDG